jgi:hypothetical protein
MTTLRNVVPFSMTRPGVRLSGGLVCGTYLQAKEVASNDNSLLLVVHQDSFGCPVEIVVLAAAQ